MYLYGYNLLRENRAVRISIDVKATYDEMYLYWYMYLLGYLF